MANSVTSILGLAEVSCEQDRLRGGLACVRLLAVEFIRPFCVLLVVLLLICLSPSSAGAAPADEYSLVPIPMTEMRERAEEIADHYVNAVTPTWRENRGDRLWAWWDIERPIEVHITGFGELSEDYERYVEARLGQMKFAETLAAVSTLTGQRFEIRKTWNFSLLERLEPLLDAVEGKQAIVINLNSIFEVLEKRPYHETEKGTAASSRTWNTVSLLYLEYLYDNYPEAVTRSSADLWNVGFSMEVPKVFSWFNILNCSFDLYYSGEAPELMVLDVFEDLQDRAFSQCFLEGMVRGHGLHSFPEGPIFYDFWGDVRESDDGLLNLEPIPRRLAGTLIWLHAAVGRRALCEDGEFPDEDDARGLALRTIADALRDGEGVLLKPYGAGSCEGVRE